MIYKQLECSLELRSQSVCWSAQAPDPMMIIVDSVIAFTVCSLCSVEFFLILLQSNIILEAVLFRPPCVRPKFYIQLALPISPSIMDGF